MTKTMLNTILPAILRAALTYVFALFLTRSMGRKLISRMTFFDFMVGITLGSLSANMMLSTKYTFLTAMTAMAVITALSIITSILNQKSFKARKFINSEPITVMNKGEILENNLKQSRMTLGELTMKLREKNIFNLADVEFAVMERDGELTVLPKPEKAPLTPSHMNIQVTSSGIMRDIIIDGVFMDNNLAASGIDFNYVQQELDKQGINNVSEVFYAGIDDNEKLYISKHNKYLKETPGKHGFE